MADSKIKTYLSGKTGAVPDLSRHAGGRIEQIRRGLISPWAVTGSERAMAAEPKGQEHIGYNKWREAQADKASAKAEERRQSALKRAGREPRVKERRVYAETGKYYDDAGKRYDVEEIPLDESLEEQRLGEYGRFESEVGMSLQDTLDVREGVGKVSQRKEAWESLMSPAQLITREEYWNDIFKRADYALWKMSENVYLAGVYGGTVTTDQYAQFKVYFGAWLDATDTNAMDMNIPDLISHIAFNDIIPVSLDAIINAGAIHYGDVITVEEAAGFSFDISSFNTDYGDATMVVTRDENGNHVITIRKKIGTQNYGDGFIYSEVIVDPEVFRKRDFSIDQVLTADEARFYFPELTGDGTFVIGLNEAGTAYTIKSAVDVSGWTVEYGVTDSDIRFISSEGVVYDKESFDEEMTRLQHIQELLGSIRSDYLSNINLPKYVGVGDGSFALDVSKDLEWSLILSMYPEEITGIIAGVGRTESTETFLSEVYGLDDNEINKFFGDPHKWQWPTALRGAADALGLADNEGYWNPVLQDISGTALEVLEPVGEFFEGVTDVWAKGLSYISARMVSTGCGLFGVEYPKLDEFIRTYEAATADNILGFLGDSAVEKSYNDLLPTWYRVPLELSMPLYWIIPGAKVLSMKLVPVVARGGLIGTSARVARISLGPLVAFETVAFKGLKFGISFPFKVGKGVVKPVMKMLANVSMDAQFNRMLSRAGIRRTSYSALRIMRNVLTNHNKEISASVQKASTSVKGNNVKHVVDAATKVAEELKPFMDAAIKESKSVPKLRSIKETSALANNMGYDFVVKGKGYRIIGNGDNIYARNLQEATNFLEAHNITGYSDGTTRLARIQELTRRGPLTAIEQAEFDALKSNVGQAYASMAARDAFPQWNIRHPYVIDTTAEARKIINEKLYLPTDNAVDRASTAFLNKSVRSGKPLSECIDAMVREMPDVSAMKIEAIGKVVKGNMKELQGLRQLAVNEYEATLRFAGKATEEATNRVNNILLTRYGKGILSKPLIKGAEVDIGKETTRIKKMVLLAAKELKSDIEFYDDLIGRIPTGGKLTVEDAYRLGIATRSTKSGKIAPLIRESGIYVKADFMNPEMYVEVSGTSALLSPPRYLFQQMDRGIFDRKIQQSVHWPAERTMQARDNFVPRLSQDFKDRVSEFGLVDADKSVRTKVFDVADKIDKVRASMTLDDLMEVAEMRSLVSKLSPDMQRRVVGTAMRLRPFYDEMRDMLNKIRVRRGEDAIGYIEDYMTYARKTGVWAKFGGWAKGAEEVPYAFDFMKAPKKITIPQELERLGGLESWELEKDFVLITQNYIDAVSKAIFNTNILQNTKIHAQALLAMGFKSNAAILERWAQECYAGVLPTIEQYIRKLPKPLWAFPYFMRAQLNRAVFPLNFAWNLTVQPSSYLLTPVHVGLRRAIGGFEYLVNSTARKLIQENVYSWQVKAERFGSVSMQDLEKSSEVLLSKGNILDRATYYGNFLTRLIESNVTGMSAWAGYQDALARGFTGRKAWQWASDVGAKTQSMYNKEDLPGLLRSRFMGTVAPFQTFSFECFNKVREISFIRYGRTGAYQTIAANTEFGQGLLRIRMLRIAEWIAGMWAWNEATEAIADKTVWHISAFVPFFNLLTGGSNVANPWNHPIPIQYVSEFWTGFNQKMQYDEWDGLREWMVRYHVVGGTQINRLLKSMEAISEGGVTDTAGKELFSLDTEDTWEIFRALLMGPYGTKAGVEYLEGKELLPGEMEEYFEGLLNGEGLIEDMKGYLRREDGFFSGFAPDFIARHLSDFLVIDTPSAYDIGERLNYGEGLIGAVDEEGNVFTMQVFARFVSIIDGHVRAEQMESSVFGLSELLFYSRDQWADYKELDEELRFEYRRNNPEVDALMFLWGEVSTLKSPAALIKLEELMEAYSIPDDAIPSLANINGEVLHLQYDWRFTFDTYEELETSEEKSAYLESHPDFANVRKEIEVLQMIDNGAITPELKEPYLEYYKVEGNWGWSQKNYMRDNPEFYQWWVEQNHETIDFNRLPNPAEHTLIEAYEAITDGKLKDVWRCQSQAGDAALVKYKGMAPMYGGNECQALLRDYPLNVRGNMQQFFTGTSNVTENMAPTWDTTVKEEFEGLE